MPSVQMQPARARIHLFSLRRVVPCLAPMILQLRHFVAAPPAPTLNAPVLMARGPSPSRGRRDKHPHTKTPIKRP